MPTSAKWMADFIQRVGFPVFIACALLVLYAFDHFKIQEKANLNNETLVLAINKNTDATTALRHFLTHKYDP